MVSPTETAENFTHGCPKCGAPRKCKYNHFEQDGLTIDAWDVSCTNCGKRETRAFRSDDEEIDFSTFDPTVCPYCGRPGSAGRITPCQPQK